MANVAQIRARREAVIAAWKEQVAKDLEEIAEAEAEAED